MLKSKSKQLSLYSILYDKIPQNHVLKLIDKAVDFTFINKMLSKSYSEHYGRPAKEPEMMTKLLVLQYLYNLSDVKVIEEASLNLAFLWFLGLNPDDKLPDPSLLAKFRTKRLEGTQVDDIIAEVVKQCITKGIIQDTGLSIDATHTSANTIKKVPERVMKHLAKKIFKNLENELGQMPSTIDTQIPNYKEIENHKEAKQVMKNFLEQTIDEVKKITDVENIPKTKKSINEAIEILSDEKFLLQKGLRSLIDKDARVGYKSHTDSFFGYKTEFAMLPDQRIITALTVNDGAYVDGTDFKKLYECEPRDGSMTHSLKSLPTKCRKARNLSGRFLT